MHECINIGTIFKGKEAVAEVFQGYGVLQHPFKEDSGQ